MVILDATIVNVALPSIQHGLHFSSSSLAWVINAYTLIFGGFLLLGGRASDLIGRKRLFAAGIALFSLASLFNGLAQSPTRLIAGRRRRAARCVRTDRASELGAVGPAQHLSGADARGCRPRAAARRQRDVRDVLLCLAVRPGDSRL